VVEYFPNKHEALNPNTGTAKKERKKKEGRKTAQFLVP
jgi:hypothetical protein